MSEIPSYTPDEFAMAANELGIPQDDWEEEGIKNYIECLAIARKLQTKITKYAPLGGLDNYNLRGRRDMADLTARALSWILLHGTDSTENVLDPSQYIIQKLRPVLNAYGLVLKKREDD